MTFRAQPSKPDLWAIQQSISNYWRDNHIFQASIDQRPATNPYRFYDGPPFITGLPHYGHLASSVAKDVIPRYWTMKGKRVDRVWGWDCHGIPIEQKVQQKLGLESNLDIEKIGVETFVQGCYDYTRSTSSEWKRYVDNFARWVDFDNAYKTMDNDYMESVWWVFKQTWDKGLIYKGKRVSMYSTKLETPISNFEVAMDDSYADVNDPTITVKFKLSDDNVFILAWTTTPWTIPANMALGVNKDLLYAKICCDDEYYILARARVEDVFKKRNYEIVDEFLGEKLMGLSYIPPFPYFQGIGNNNHTILSADFATDDSGTGIVHQAPEFGEDDFNLGMKAGLTITEAMDSSGHYTSQIVDLEGTFYRDANDKVIQLLMSKDLLFDKGSITHRVAHCPRSGVPLVYKAQDSWFVDIQAIKPKLLARNEDINWYPEHFKHGRFAKSIENAPDWCISRTRYWGTPMPVYAPEEMIKSGRVDVEQVVVVGSREELYSLQKTGSNSLTKIIFVRHGERHMDDIDGGLSDVGRQQAQRFALELEHEDVDVILSSSVKRCIETVTPLSDLKNINVVVDERRGSLERKRLLARNKERLGVATLMESNETLLSQLLQDSVVLDQESLTRVLSEYAGKTIVICTHGEVIASIFSGLKGGPLETYFHQPVDKGSFTILYFQNDKELDMHRPYIDDIWFTHNNCRYVRVAEVLDCWFESGSMPYGQMHYPFEHKAAMEASFPADYIVEYTGQIRAWFYVMHVLGVILFDKPAFKNVVCHGVVYGNDGRKMSKSLGNFPDPKPTFETYGGDAIRMSILGSPLFHAGDTSVTEEGIAEALRNNILPLRNAFSFFVTYARIDKFDPANLDERRDNYLDQRIISELQELIVGVDTELLKYDLQQSSRLISSFLDNLTNRYIRRSRRRFWKSENDADKLQAYATLYRVLLVFCQVAAPFMPFIAEYVYRELSVSDSSAHGLDYASVHLSDFPQATLSLVNKNLERDMRLVQDIIRIGLGWRSKHTIRVRQPLRSVTIGVVLDDYYKDIIAEELNVKSVLLDASINDMVTKICKPDAKVLGPKFGADLKLILEEAKSGHFEEHGDGSVTVKHFRLQLGEFSISYIKKTVSDGDSIEVDNGIVVAIDPLITPDLELEGYARDLVRYIQEARKEADYGIADRIQLSLLNIESTDFLRQVLDNFGEYIAQETLSTIVADISSFDIEKEVEVGGVLIRFGLKK